MNLIVQICARPVGFLQKATMTRRRSGAGREARKDEGSKEFNGERRRTHQARRSLVLGSGLEN